MLVPGHPCSCASVLPCESANPCQLNLLYYVAVMCTGAIRPRHKTAMFIPLQPATASHWFSDETAPLPSFWFNYRKVCQPSTR